MKLDDIFHGENLKAEDLKGKDVSLTISSWEVAEFEEGGKTDKKIKLHFSETDRTLILNKTNGYSVAEGLTDDLDNWAGGVITLYPTKTDFGGKRVDCIRIKDARPAKGVTTPAEAFPAGDSGPVPGEPPF